MNEEKEPEVVEATEISFEEEKAPFSIIAIIDESYFVECEENENPTQAKMRQEIEEQGEKFEADLDGMGVEAIEEMTKAFMKVRQKRRFNN